MKRDAHRKLMRKKMTMVGKRKEWINGYEFGLFTNENITRLMAETMHIKGRILEDVVSPTVHQAALIGGHWSNVRIMETIIWNVPVILGIIKRPDAHILLRQVYGLNGYEYAILHDKSLCKELGRMMKHYNIPLYQVIRFSVFKQSPYENIKTIMII